MKEIRFIIIHISIYIFGYDGDGSGGDDSGWYSGKPRYSGTVVLELFYDFVNLLVSIALVSSYHEVTLDYLCTLNKLNIFQMWYNCFVSMKPQWRRTGPDHLTDLVWVEVLLHEAVDDVGYLGAQDQVTHRHQVRAEQLAQFLQEGKHSNYKWCRIKNVLNLRWY